MSLNEDIAPPESEETLPCWLDVFFGENSIVNTIQTLLLQTHRTVDDLCTLGSAIHKSSVIMAFTSRGMVPLAGDPLYVFPFEQMSKQQLSVLRTTISNHKDYYMCSYDHDNFIVHDKQAHKVDDAILLFGVACIMVNGLSSVTTSKFGSSFTKLKPPQVAYYVNATLFRLVNACCMPRGTLETTERMLHKHGVAVRGEPLQA